MVIIKGILAFIAGAIGGAMVVSLTTPHSGKLTRAKLRLKYEEGIEKAEEQAEEYRNKLKSISKNVAQNIKS